MERMGTIGFLWSWTLNLMAIIIDEEFLKEVSLILAIIVSILTILWYLSQFIMKRKELWKSLKEIFGDKRKP